MDLEVIMSKEELLKDYKEFIENYYCSKSSQKRLLAQVTVGEALKNKAYQNSFKEYVTCYLSTPLKSVRVVVKRTKY